MTSHRIKVASAGWFAPIGLRPPLADVTLKTLPLCGNLPGMADVVPSEPAQVPRQWIGAAGVVLIVGILLTMPIRYPGRMLGAVCDFAHLPVFAVMVYIVTRLVGGTNPTWTLAATIAVTAAVFGLCAEVLQGSIGRSSTMGDAVSNVIGSIGGFVFATRSKWTRPALVFALLLLIVAMVFVYLHPVGVVRDIVRQQSDFPMLASFEDDLELSRWTVRRGRFNRSQKFSSDGEWCIRWKLAPGQYPRCTLRWPPGDWSDCDSFEFDVWNESSEPIQLAVKIEDFTHNRRQDDRFERITDLPTGKTTIRVNLDDVRTAPVDREMDMTLISRVQLFTIDLEQPRVLFLDRVRLNR